MILPGFGNKWCLFNNIPCDENETNYETRKISISGEINGLRKGIFPKRSFC